MTATQSPSGATVPDPPLPPLVGRREVLEHVEAHLLNPEPPLFLLAGEAGVGKSRILLEASRRAATQGWTVLSGGCHGQGGHAPYAPISDALKHHLAGQDTSTLRRKLEGCAWLVQLLPDLANGPIPSLPAHALPEAQQRRLMVDALQRYLGNIAAPAGTLLVLDDLQWAGRDALDLLTMLLRGTMSEHERSASLRIIGAYRDTEAQGDERLAPLLSDSTPAELIRHERLDPLSSPEAAELLARLLPEREGTLELSQRIVQRTGGIPFFVVSYAQSWRSSRGAGAGAAQPWDLRRDLHQRVTRLGEHTRDLLGALAVIGRRAEIRLLVEVTGRPEAEVAAALDEACRARLLVEDGRSGYQFLHDLIREVADANIGSARRATLHRTVAEALERRMEGAAPELLGYHYDRSDVPERALPYLEMAGDRAEAQHAHDAAEAQYSALLNRLDLLGRSSHAARIRLKLGELLERTGRYDAALLVLEPAAQVFLTQRDSHHLTRVATAIGAAHGRRRTNAEGIARMRSLLEQLELSAPTAPLAETYEAFGHLLRDDGAFEEALSVAARAAELATDFDDRRVAVLAEQTRIESLSALGRMTAEEAYVARRRSLSQIEELGDLDMLSSAHHNLAYASAHLGHFQTGREYAEQAVADAEELGDPGELTIALALRGWLHFLGGEWQAARTDLERAVALTRGIDQSWYTPYPLVWLAELCLAEGDHASAATLEAEATDLAERSGDVQALRLACRVRADLEILEGRPDAALARLLPLLDDRGQEDLDATSLLPGAARAYLEQGEIDRAGQTAELALSRARRQGGKLALIDALQVHVLVALRCGRPDMAERSLEEGLALARSMGYPRAEAQLLRLRSAPARAEQLLRSDG